MYDKHKYKDAKSEVEHFIEKYPDHIGKYPAFSVDTPIIESKAFNCVISDALGDKETALKDIKTILMKNMKNFTVW